MTTLAESATKELTNLLVHLTGPGVDSPELEYVLDWLTSDLDVFHLSGGFSLLLQVVSDRDYSINDYDSDGRTAYGYRDERGRLCRPESFNDNARLVSGDLWWEPPGSNIIGPIPWSEEQMRVEFARVKELIEDGFFMVGLSLRETLTDSLGNSHDVEVASEWEGGCDCVCPDVVLGLIDQLSFKITGDLVDKSHRAYS